MLDDQDGIARVHKPLQHVEQLAHVLEVQTGRGFVQNIERAAGLTALQLARKLHALRFAARKRRGGLPQANVTEPDVVQGLQLALDARDALEERERLVHRHVQHVEHVLAAISDLQRLAVVALAVAHFARDVDVRQEVHLDLDLPVALARFAAASGHVEAETAWAVATRLRLGRRREKRAHVVPQADVRSRVRTRRAPDRALVDVDDLVDGGNALQLAIGAGTTARPVHTVCERGSKRIGHQRAFARARNAGHDREGAELHAHVHVLEVVLGRAFEHERTPAGMAAFRRHLDATTSRKIVRRKRAP